MPVTRMKKKRLVTYKDSLKGYNVLFHYYIHFLYKISFLWKTLKKFQSIFNLTKVHYSRPSNEI